MYFNSRDCRHKPTFGAVAAGEGQWFSVEMPRDMGVRAVRLIAHTDDHYLPAQDLEWKSTDGFTEWWSTFFTFSQPGIYFYHFEYETSWGTGLICLAGHGAGEFSDSGSEWQQTVYRRGDPVRSPDRAGFPGGIMYQIFPDRFFCSGEKKTGVPADRRMHADMTDTPEYTADPATGRWNKDFFGGDLKGIERKLCYLESLGVTHIYLNPIFEAHSNHRYDTADYTKIDPLLGTEEDFVSLCESAKEKGIAVILDGVFSHTGDDSVYFNKLGRYDSAGAYNDPDSPYRPWFKFTPDGDYVAWWGIKTLPETNEDDPSFRGYIGEVVKKWLRLGASGFRLDVADELPDDFIVFLRKVIKTEKPDAILLGEVWEDASCKISHGGRRAYFLGDELDGVMNYPFRTAIIDFLTTGRAEDFNDAILTICEHYPKYNLDRLMNILGTHDTERILSVLGGKTGERLSSKRQEHVRLNKGDLAAAKRRLTMAYTLLYTLPGVPCIYYGDEAYCEGLKDPFNRRFFPWGSEDTPIAAYLRQLAGIRKKHSCLKDGMLYSVSAASGCVAYVRANGRDALMVIVNNNPHEITYYLPHDWHGANVQCAKCNVQCSQDEQDALPTEHTVNGNNLTSGQARIENNCAVIIPAETGVILSR